MVGVEEDISMGSVLASITTSRGGVMGGGSNGVSGGSSIIENDAGERSWGNSSIVERRGVMLACGATRPEAGNEPPSWEAPGRNELGTCEYSTGAVCFLDHQGNSFAKKFLIACVIMLFWPSN